MSFLKKRQITLLGLASGLLFTLTFYLMLSFQDDELLIYMFYLPIPAAFFGLFMLAALGKYKPAHQPELLVLFSILIYSLLFFVFITQYIEYLLGLRRLLMGGTGAVLFILAVRFVYHFPFTWFDYILAFVTGTVSTFFMWTDGFKVPHAEFVFVGLVLWQTAVAMVIDRRVKLSRISEVSEGE